MTATLNDAPIPLYDPIARVKRKEYGKREDPLEGHLTRPWVDYFNNLVKTLAAAPSRKNVVELPAQQAAIGATDLSGGSLSAGIYRLSWWVRITRAATTSSSVTVTLDYSDGGAALAFSGAALAGNTITTWQSESKLIRVDVGSPVRYSTAYASVGAVPMQYALVFVLEEVKA